MRFRRFATAASIALLASLGLTAPSTSAAGTSLIGTANGVVGIAQNVEVRAPQFASQTIGLNFSLAGQVQTTANVALNAAGSGSTVWTPSDAGSWTVSGSGGFATATASNATISAVPTTTTLYAANQTPVDTATRLTAVVTPTAGTGTPTGSVIFTDQFGTTLASVPATSHGAGAASAVYNWTPTAPTTGLTITATYSPSAGAGGSANFQASSGSNGIQVTSGGPLVSLTLPGTLTVGQETVVGAVMNQATGSDGSPIQGSVSFLTNVNGNQVGISGSTTLSGGRISTSWTPATAGNQIISAEFSASNSFISGTGTQAVNVLPAPGSDPLSIGVRGSAAWPANATVSAPANASLTLFTTTGSGAPASISESGPCLVDGATLITATKAATCTLTVSSPGTGAFGASTQTVTIDVQAPKRKKRR